MELEVRCCCQPRRLLGWMQLPDTYHREVRFQIMMNGFVRDVVLPIENYGPREDKSFRPAIKSMEFPVELFRLLPGFRENKEH